MLPLLLTTLMLVRLQSSAAAAAAAAESPEDGGGGDGDQGPSNVFRPVGHETYGWPWPYPGPVGFPAAPQPHHGDGDYPTATTMPGESRDDLQWQMNSLYNMVHLLRPPPMAQPPMVLLTLAQSTIAQPVMTQQPMVQPAMTQQPMVEPAMTQPVETQQDQSLSHRLIKRQLQKEANQDDDEWYKGKKKKTTNLASRSTTV